MSRFNLLKQKLFFFNPTPAKIPMLELNNLFAFHQTQAFKHIIHTRVVQLIHNFLEIGNNIKSSVYIFFTTSLSKWFAHSSEDRSCFDSLRRIGERVRFPCNPDRCEDYKSDCLFNKLKLKFLLVIILAFYKVCLNLINSIFCALFLIVQLSKINSKG